MTHVQTAADAIERLLIQLENPLLSQHDIERIEQKLKILKPYVINE